MTSLFKIVVYVPTSHADAVRQAIGDAGGGKIGNYSHCSFTSKGMSRFLPLEGAHPTIGEVGKLEEVDEERIEFLCERALAKQIIAAIRKAHLYEEVALDVYSLIGEEEL